MPVYTFRCNDTGDLFNVKMSIAEYDPEKVTSPFTGSNNVTRIIDRVTVARIDDTTSNLSRPGHIESMDNIGEKDPKALAYTMRKLADESGQKTDSHFEGVVSRLERGKKPSDIKNEVAPPPPPKPKSKKADNNP